MTPAGARLDLLLRRAIDEFKNRKPSGGSIMPEIGGKKLAGNFREGMASLRKQLDDMHLEVASAITELQGEVAAGKEVAKQIRSEAADVRAAFGDVLGNAPPDNDGKGT